MQWPVDFERPLDIFQIFMATKRHDRCHMQEARTNPDSETVLVLLRAGSTLPAGGTEPVQWSHGHTEAGPWDDEGGFAWCYGDTALVTECQSVLYGERVREHCVWGNPDIIHPRVSRCCGLMTPSPKGPASYTALQGPHLVDCYYSCSGKSSTEFLGGCLNRALIAGDLFCLSEQLREISQPTQVAPDRGAG